MEELPQRQAKNSRSALPHQVEKYFEREKTELIGIIWMSREGKDGGKES